MCTTTAKSFQTKLALIRGFLEIGASMNAMVLFSSWPASSSIAPPFDQRRKFGDNWPWADQRRFLSLRRRYVNDNCLLAVGASSAQNKQVWKRPV